MGVLLLVELAQGVLGFAQYLTGLPVLLVGLLAVVARGLQSGYLYHYAFAMIVGLAALVGYGDPGEAEPAPAPKSGRKSKADKAAEEATAKANAEAIYRERSPIVDIARVKVPKSLPRWVPTGRPHRFVPLEQLIGANLGILFILIADVVMRAIESGGVSWTLRMRSADVPRLTTVSGRSTSLSPTVNTWPALTWPSGSLLAMPAENDRAPPSW